MLEGAIDKESELSEIITPPIPTDTSLETQGDRTPVLALSELPVELLENSFLKIKTDGEEFVASFYKNLFDGSPEIKSMFANVDMAQHHKKFLSSLILVVENLHEPQTLGPVLTALGARHVGYGAIPGQYPALGKALLSTLEEYLQEDWTPELKKAWTSAYRTITAQMLQDVVQKTNSVVKTEEKPVNPPEINLPDTETEILLWQKCKDFSLQIFLKLWKNWPQKILKQSISAFWDAPIWLVVLIALVVWSWIIVAAEENSALDKIIEGADTISLIIALVLFIKEAPDRRKQFHYQAWSTIDAANGVKVSYARILALQDLNADDIPLKGLDVPGGEFVEIQLPGANLSNSNLGEADFSNANLNHADLNKANLQGIKLTGANLSAANLSFSILTEANLSSANLKGANLVCADLSGANLRGANLKNANLSGANLSNAYLTGVNLKGAKINISDLEAEFIEGAILPDGGRYRKDKN
ncbi:MAG: Flavohemoprotein [Chroococcopsis gigantea SAG 12.99]|jgi:uncharacterized protein YjbI with pentapeptide repeats/hemoglobin-like flavoprotein|nr:pentapeptide repeat-containing protein [Chlorogloea purpurea SAG 13.99]MDV2999469.1 Flavohemoprotein [Chroococcopsis gigantea SAG 12.99]